jgi:GNAT superfamily N-acetyltransferase
VSDPPEQRRVEVTTWSLQMLDPGRLGPAGPPRLPVTVVQSEVVSPELSRFLYTAVGGDWYWLDRLPWTYDTWLAYLDRPDVQTWLAMSCGTPAGYAELEAQPGGDVEVVYFGLLPQFIGHGVGGHLLTEVTRRAWALPGTERVWLHTCTLDGPNALANYRARGFEVWAEETAVLHLPGHPTGPWAGARPSER